MRLRLKWAALRPLPHSLGLGRPKFPPPLPPTLLAHVFGVQMDREKSHHSPELYMVWVEKSEFVMRVRRPGAAMPGPQGLHQPAGSGLSRPPIFPPRLPNGNQAIRDNPFKSDFFYWVDIGCFRSPENMPRFRSAFRSRTSFSCTDTFALEK